MIFDHVCSRRQVIAIIKKVLILLLAPLLAGCVSNLQQLSGSDESARTIHLSYAVTSKKDVKYADYFIRHLDRWYLKLTPDHKSFNLLNAKELAPGTRIDNEEESKGIRVHHLYTVTQLDEKEGIFRIVSPDSKAMVWGFLPAHFKTVLTLRFENQPDGSRSGRADLDLVFDTKTDKDLAVFIGVAGVWQKHTEIEMANSAKVIDSLDNI